MLNGNSFYCKNRFWLIESAISWKYKTFFFIESLYFFADSEFVTKNRDYHLKFQKCLPSPKGQYAILLMVSHTRLQTKPLIWNIFFHLILCSKIIANDLLKRNTQYICSIIHCVLDKLYEHKLWRSWNKFRANWVREVNKVENLWVALTQAVCFRIWSRFTELWFKLAETLVPIFALHRDWALCPKIARCDRDPHYPSDS